MKHSQKHLFLFGRIVLALFLISNSGFTMLITNCLMKNKSCCENMTSAETCGKTKTSHSVSLNSNGASCMETKLVGGSSSTKQAVVEHTFHIPSLKEITSFVVSFSNSVFSQLNSLFTFSTKLLANVIASLEKYVLTSILRI